MSIAEVQAEPKAIAEGDRLPDATLNRATPDGPQEVSMARLTEGRKVVIFAVPGAFTPTCHSAHMPSFLSVHDALRAKGVDEVICLAVNDPFVLQAWGDETGATTAGITLVSDGASEFTRAVGMIFDAPQVGFMGRSVRYAMLVEDGVVRILHVEQGRGTCELSSGPAMLAAMG